MPMNKALRYIATLLLAVVFLACQKNDFHLLSKSEMVTVLTELYLTEGSFEASFVRDEQEKLAYYNSLFEKHGTTREDFEKSAAYYAQKGKELELIYETVLDSLKAKEQLVNNHFYHPLPPEVEERTVVWDTLNLWTEASRVVWHPDSAERENSLPFEFSDSNFFAVGDRFVLYFLQSSARCDSLRDAYVSMFVRYRDDVVDSVEAMLLPDERVRRYTLTVNNIDSLRPLAVYGNLLRYDSVWGTPDRWFDSIAIYRIYDCKNNPLPDSLKTRFQVNESDTDTLKKSPLLRNKSLRLHERPLDLKPKE